MLCPKCGKQIADDSAFCPICGADLRPAAPQSKPQPAPAEAAAPEAAPEAAPQSAPAAQKKPLLSAKNAKLALIACVAVAAIIVLIVVLVNVIGSKAVEGQKAYGYYRIDDTYYLTDLDGNAKEITSKIKNATRTLVSDNGKYVFYLTDSGLYRAETGEADEDPVKCAPAVAKYHVSADANLVTYVNEDKLYQFNVKKEERSDSLAQNVNEFYVSEDGGTVLYSVRTEKEATEEEKSSYWYTPKYVYTWYYKTGSNDSEKIVTDPNSIEYTEDFSRIVYIETIDEVRTLCVKDAGKDKEKIASDVKSFFFANGDTALKDVYFTKAGETENSAFVTIYKNSTENKLVGEANLLSCVYEDGSFYYVVKDESSYSLRYFNGKESVTITTALNYSKIYTMGCSEISPRVAFTETDDVETTYIAIGSNKGRLKINGSLSAGRGSSDEKVVYCLDYDKEEKTNTLVKFTLDGKLSDPETIAKDVNRIISVTDDGKQVVYTKDSSYWSFDLYINDEKVDSEISEYYGCCNGVHLYEKDDILKYSKGGKGEKVSFVQKSDPDIHNDTFVLYGREPDGENGVYTFDGSLHLLAEGYKDLSVLYDAGGSNDNRYIKNSYYY